MIGAANRDGMKLSSNQAAGIDTGATPDIMGKQQDQQLKLNEGGTHRPMAPSTPIEEKLHNLSGYDQPFGSRGIPHWQNRNWGHRQNQSRGGYMGYDNWRRRGSGYSVRRGSDPPGMRHPDPLDTHRFAYRPYYYGPEYDEVRHDWPRESHGYY